MMPDELSKLIQDFARPRTRPNWRAGGAFPSPLFYLGIDLKYPRIEFDDYFDNEAEMDWLVQQGNLAMDAAEFEAMLAAL